MEDTREIDGKLALVSNEDMGDWFTIERAEHDNRTWMEETEYGMALCYSGRITNACVEGDTQDMLAIALAIEMRSDFSAKRCSVDATGDRVLFCSPRNSSYEASVPVDVAVDLANAIRLQLEEV